MICITRIIRCYFCLIVSVRCDSQDSSVCRDNFNVRSDDTKRMIEHRAESIGERTGLGKISRMRGTLPSEINSLESVSRMLSPGGPKALGLLSGEENTC